MYLLDARDFYGDDFEPIASFSEREAAESAKKVLEERFNKSDFDAVYAGYYHGRYMVVSYFRISYIPEWTEAWVGQHHFKEEPDEPVGR